MSVTNLAPAASKRSVFLHRLLLRRLSTETPPLPPPGNKAANEDAVFLNHAVKHLLETPENDWSTSQLNNLQLPPTTLFQITRRLPSYNTALKFFQFLQNNSPSLPETSLSSTFRAVLELASREPSAESKLTELYNAIKERNLTLTVNATTDLIRGFDRAGLVDKSILVYHKLDESEKTVNVRNVLVNILFRNGRKDDAFKMLDEILQKDSVCPPNDITWEIVSYPLMNWNRFGISDNEIVGLVSKFGKHGIFPSSNWLTQFLRILCRDNRSGKALDILHELMELGAPLRAASCNVLLTSLGRSGDFNKLNELMVKMKENEIKPDVVTFGILINHLCKSRRVDAALEVFEQLSEGKQSDGISVKLDVVIYNTLIDGLCKVGREEEALALIERMTSCSPNSITYNCLIDGFCKSGNVEKAKELFETMKSNGVKPNVATVNSYIGGLCRHGKISSALEFFDEMQGNGLMGNAITYSILITSFCNVSNIGKAKELFDDMLKSGCSTDAIVYYSLISGLSQAGKLDDACFVLSKLKEAGFFPDLVCYNVLIGGFCKRNKFDEAKELLKEMHISGLKPDTVTYNSLISYFSKSGNYSTARKLLRNMLKDGLLPTVVTYGTLIHSYCMHGKLDDAMTIYKEMTSKSKVPPNTVIYNILIDSLCKNNEVERAFDLMEDMNVHGVKPNTNTYNAMFKGLREKKWTEKAYGLMDSMIMQGCEPDYITMEVLTKWLSEIGETAKLKKFVQRYDAPKL